MNNPGGALYGVGNMFASLDEYKYALNADNQIYAYGALGVGIILDTGGKLFKMLDNAADMAKGIKKAADTVNQIDNIADGAKAGKNILGDMPLGLPAPTGKLDLEVSQVLGGAYKDVRAANTGGQVHHLIAAKVDIPGLSKSEYPSVFLESFAEHVETGNWGNRPTSSAFRDTQQSLVNINQNRSSLYMGIKDVHSKLGSKYNEGLLQSIDYAESLPQFKKIK
jgi:hypothetical protein